MVSDPRRNRFPSLNSAKTTCATLPRQLIPASNQTAKTNLKTFFRILAVFFSKSERYFGNCDAITHKIEVYPGAKPVKLRNRRMSLHYKQYLQDKVDVFLRKYLKAPFHSPYSVPAMLMPKNNVKLRLVIDYLQLNKQTMKCS